MFYGFLHASKNFLFKRFIDYSVKVNTLGVLHEKYCNMSV